MPSKIPHPCAYPGCPEVTLERYCPKHKPIAARQYNQSQRSPDHNKIYGRRWRTIRDLYIQAHPLCEECLKSGKYVPADEVHHIVPTDQGGTHDFANLMALCQSCHTKTRPR
ncbi:MAG: HNH endonuclease [Oscillospiraceae bacterium]|nr:HNH endonuclease [Oscillospiraceae bacterium]